jgi:mannose-6-phosphate isomerase-like protein (cupin superfamily)
LTPLAQAGGLGYLYLCGGRASPDKFRGRVRLFLYGLSRPATKRRWRAVAANRGRMVPRLRSGVLKLLATFSFANKRNAMDKVNLAEKFSKISEYWKPYVAAELNGQQVKLDKLKGEFVFHHHQHEDEMFLVVKGRFRMEFRDRHEWIEEGEFIVIPRGVEHKPVAEQECWLLLFEPSTTVNTGNVVNERTMHELERV